MKNNASATLSLVKIYVHLFIISSNDEAVTHCVDEEKDWETYWDCAVALTVGRAVGMQDIGSDTNVDLFFELAQDLCERFDSCYNYSNP